MTPEWLPDLFPVADKPIEQVVALLYAVFVRDFKQGRPSFSGSPVRWDELPEEVYGRYYERGFWHLIAREVVPGSRQREFEPKRAERLPWCAPTLTHADEPCIKVWVYVHGDQDKMTPRKLAENTRTYVWLVDHDYVVVLHRRRLRSGDCYFLKTGYHVDGPSSRRWFERSYAKRVQ